MSVQVDPKYLAALEKAASLGGLCHVSGLTGEERNLIARRLLSVYEGAFATTHPRIIHHGPAAVHTQACAVHHDKTAAVYDCNSGVFHPSWAAQSQGWKLVQAKTWWQRLLLNLGFGDQDF